METRTSAPVGKSMISHPQNMNIKAGGYVSYTNPQAILEGPGAL